jgi:hypothetical protein
MEARYRMNTISLTTAARLLRIQQQAFDNAGHSRSITRPPRHHGAWGTMAILLIAAALAVFAWGGP